MRTKRETMSPTLSHLRESGISFIKKTSLTGTVIELFLTFYFFVKHGGSVSATVPQQTYCASNSEQGGGEPEVPAPSVVTEGKIYMEGFKEVLNAGETLWMILA